MEFIMDDMQALALLSGQLSNAALNRGAAGATPLRKALTTSANFLGLNLEAEAKMLLPVYAGLRHRFPSDSPKMGAAQAQWRAQLGFGSTAFGGAAYFGTANGANGGTTNPSATSFAADYKSLSINGAVQREAIQQALGFDNAMAIDTIWALSALLSLEEKICLFANEAAITMTAVTGNASTATAINTFGAGVWSVAVTAITGQATLPGGAGTAGTVLNNVGESTIQFNDITVGVGNSDFLDISWPYVPGALGYKVYCNATVGAGHTAAALFLVDPNLGLAYSNLVSGSYLSTLGDPIVVPTNQTYVTVNHVQIYTAPLNTQPIAPSADGTANANVFEGTAAWCLKNTIYGQALPFRNVIDMKGAKLTGAANGVKEFNQIFATQWQINNTSPSLIVCSTNSIDSLGNLLATAGGNNQVRLDVYQDRNMVVGGLYYGGYVNRYASAQAGMRTTVDIWAHPYMPDGTFLFLSEDVPATTVPYSRTGKTFELDVQTPYEYFELGRTDRSFPYDVWVGQTLKCYWPSAQSAIVGARVDS